jgi:arylformamidase
MVEGINPMSESASNEWIDCTRTLHNGMVQWPGDPPFLCERISTLAGPGSANVSAIQTCLHVGTHIDAPLHFVPDGTGAANIPLTTLCGQTVVLDVPVDRDIAAADLSGVLEGERVLLRTANAPLWERGTFDERFHALTIEAARWLVDQKVRVVGVDYLSVDSFDASDGPVHRILLGAGIPIIEGVDLSGVEPGRYEMVALPLKVAQADGAPTRVILRPIPSSLEVHQPQ